MTKPNRKWPVLLPVLLILLVIITAVAVIQTVSSFSPGHQADTDILLNPDQANTQPLQSDGQNQDTQTIPGTDAQEPSGPQATAATGNSGTPDPLPSAEATGSASAPTETQGRPELNVTDFAGTWSTQTQVEIFRIQYENGDAKVTVAGANGQKVVAPGTENVYTFDVANTGTAALDYQLSASAVLSDGQQEYEIPLEVRIRDARGNYCLGSLERWVPMADMNQLKEESTLSAGHYDGYTLDWRWAFESGKDELDTLLGNMAADQDLTLTVTFRVHARGNENGSGGIPVTGDNSRVYLSVGLLAVSLLAVLLLGSLTANSRRKENGQK